MNIFRKTVNSQKQAQVIIFVQGAPIHIKSAEQVELLEGAIQRLMQEDISPQSNAYILDMVATTRIGGFAYNGQF